MSAVNAEHVCYFTDMISFSFHASRLRTQNMWGKKCGLDTIVLLCSIFTAASAIKGGKHHLESVKEVFHSSSFSYTFDIYKTCYCL